MARGRPPSAKTLVDRQLGRNVVHPVLPAGESFVIPNHSGDHTAGETDEPTADRKLANKKYVDDEVAGAVTPPAGSEGEIQFNESSAFQADSGLFWDNVNKRLGIGTSSPTQTVDIDGTLRVRGGFIEMNPFAVGTNNIFIGAKPPGLLGSSQRNLSVGIAALDSLTSGYSNNGIGVLALTATNSGRQNNAVGDSAMSNNTTGIQNTAMGQGALNGNVGGHFNSGFGTNALVRSASGDWNTAIGQETLLFNISGDLNTAIGAFSGGAATGSGNVFLGSYAGRYQTGSDKLAIDNQDRGDVAAELTDSLIYGVFNATPTSQVLRINALVSASDKAGFSPIGGHLIKLTNKTGANSVEGQLVRTSTTTANAVQTAASNSLDTIGVIYNAGISDGSEVWVVVSGTAEVLIDAGGCALGDRIVTSATAGSAAANNAPSVAVHFQECGHVNEAIVGAGLVKATLHLL